MHKLPPLIELRAFDAAARHLSFKKAAAELGVTPTAISHQIRLLERYCGRALFRRRPRPLSLTAAGARLFPAIRDGLETFAAAIAALKQDGDQEPLRVTTTNAFASRWLIPRLPGWAKLHPEAPLEVIGTDSILDLDAGDGDVAIRYATRRTAPTDGVADQFLSDTFWRLRSATAVSGPPEVPCRSQEARSCALLLVTVRSRSAHMAELARGCKRRWRQVPDFKDLEHLSFREELHAIEAVTGGQGVGIFSDVLVARELSAGMLVKAFALSLPGYSFYVVRRREHPREKVIRAFSNWVRSVA